MVFERSSRRITELQFARSLFLTISLDLDDRDLVPRTYLVLLASTSVILPSEINDSELLHGS